MNTVFGIVCGLAIVRGSFRGKGILNAFVDLPLALSPVVVGLLARPAVRHPRMVRLAAPARLRGSVRVAGDRAGDRVRLSAVRRARGRARRCARSAPSRSRRRRRSARLAGRRSGGSRCHRSGGRSIYGVVLTTARCLGEFGAVAIVSGNIEGKTQTATLRVEDAYQFAYGQYAGRVRDLARSCRSWQ